MSKIQELKDKHPEFMIDLIGDLSQRDPSGTNKYLPFMVKVSAEAVKEYFSSTNYLDDTFVQLINLVKGFERYCKLNLIENKDIYSYAEITDIESAVNEAKDKNTTREVKDGQTIVLYEDNKNILVKCLSRESAILYGKNTKWCTSAVNNNRFIEYASNGVLLYFIHKPSVTDMPPAWRKLGFNIKKSTDAKIIWNSKSEQISDMFEAMKLYEYVGQEIMDIVRKEFDLSIPNTYLTKDDDNNIIFDTTLLAKEPWSHKANEITEYIANLKDERLKNTKKDTVTFDPINEIEKEIEEESVSATRELPAGGRGLTGIEPPRIQRHGVGGAMLQEVGNDIDPNAVTLRDYPRDEFGANIMANIQPNIATSDLNIVLTECMTPSAAEDIGDSADIRLSYQH